MMLSSIVALVTAFAVWQSTGPRDAGKPVLLNPPSLNLSSLNLPSLKLAAPMGAFGLAHHDSTLPARRRSAQHADRATAKRIGGHTTDVAAIRPPGISDNVPVTPRSTSDKLPVMHESIDGVHTIELTADELARIGIRVDTVGIWMTWHHAGADPFVWSVTTHGVLLPPDEPVLKGVDVPATSPLRITDDLGQSRALVEMETEDSLNKALRDMLAQASAQGSDSLTEAITKRMTELTKQREDSIVESTKAGRMIAILVHADPAARRYPSGWRPDCIMWYEPTADLIDRLPVRVRTRIQTEMQYVDALAHRNAVNDTVPQRPALPDTINGSLAGEVPYIDGVRSVAGALIETSITPNPAHGRTVLSYHLAQPRAVEITLHDVMGRRLRQLAPLAEQQAGHVDVMVDLDGISAGTYLVAITTPNGERAVQRLIVLK